MDWLIASTRVANATLSAAPTCCETAAIVVSPARAAAGMSAKAMVLRHVNCIDRVMPATTSTTHTNMSDLSSVSRAHAAMASAANSPLAITIVRKPKRRNSRVVPTFITRLPAI